MNAILFFFADGIYASKTIQQQFLHDLSKANREQQQQQQSASPFGQSPSAAGDDDDDSNIKLQAKKTDLNELLTGAGRLATSQQLIHQANEDISTVCRIIQLKVQLGSSGFEKTMRYQAQTKRLQELKDMCKNQLESLEKERLRVAQLRRALVPRAQLISQQTQKLAQQKDLLRKAREKLQHIKKTKLQVAVDKCNARRRKLVSQLMRIYPISSSPSTKDEPRMYTIRGIRLPNANLINYEEEQISTALGYCGHLVLMLSKYLQVPLRYRIIYRASRSDICDDVVQSFSQFPLFFRNADERRFQCGCILLNKNIEHMLNVRVANWFQHAKHASSQNTLENLEILISNEVPK
jgi:hypothetical protein